MVAGCMGRCRAARPVVAQYEPAVLASCVVNFMLAVHSTCIHLSGVFGSLLASSSGVGVLCVWTVRHWSCGRGAGLCVWVTPHSQQASMPSGSSSAPRAVRALAEGHERGGNRGVPCVCAVGGWVQSYLCGYGAGRTRSGQRLLQPGACLSTCWPTGG